MNVLNLTISSEDSAEVNFMKKGKKKEEKCGEGKEVNLKSVPLSLVSGN